MRCVTWLAEGRVGRAGIDEEFAVEVVPSGGFGRRSGVRGRPERCQRQRDARSSQDVGPDVGDVFGIDELDKRKDCCEQELVSYASEETRQTGNVPGMIIVWKPPMKMICMLPNCFIPSLRRSRSDHPSLAQNMALKKQMLMVNVMSFALASQVVLLQNSSGWKMHLTEMADWAMRNPMATTATNAEMAKMDIFCHVFSVTLTT